jgi:hypothetical protein
MTSSPLQFGRREQGHRGNPAAKTAGLRVVFEYAEAHA